MKILTSFLWRAARTAVAIALASVAAYAAHDPRWIWIAPVIAATGKALRDLFNITNIPL